MTTQIVASPGTILALSRLVLPCTDKLLGRLLPDFFLEAHPCSPLCSSTYMTALTIVSNTLVCLPRAPGMYTVHGHTCRINTHIHKRYTLIIKIIILKIFPMASYHIQHKIQAPKLNTLLPFLALLPAELMYWPFWQLPSRLIFPLVTRSFLYEIIPECSPYLESYQVAGYLYTV